MECNFDTRLHDCATSLYIEDVDPLGNFVNGAFWRLKEAGAGKTPLTLSSGETVMDYNRRMDAGKTTGILENITNNQF